MDHVFIIFSKSPNTKKTPHNTKYGLKELYQVYGLNTHLDSLPNLQHLHQTHWRFYQRMRSCQGMPNTVLCRRRALVRFSATVPVSTKHQWVQPLNSLGCVRMGPLARYTPILKVLRFLHLTVDPLHWTLLISKQLRVLPEPGEPLSKPNSHKRSAGTSTVFHLMPA